MVPTACVERGGLGNRSYIVVPEPLWETSSSLVLIALDMLCLQCWAHYFGKLHLGAPQKKTLFLGVHGCEFLWIFGNAIQK